MDLIEGIRWRYRLYLEPYVVVYRSPSTAIRRYCGNRQCLRTASPPVFVYANPTNMGDYASHLGLKQLAGFCGVELLCDGPAVSSTLSMLKRGPGPGRSWGPVLVGGGGLFHDYFDDFWRGLLDTKVPFAIFGVGINETAKFRRRTDPGILRELALRAIAIHVRDEFTRRVLEENGAESVTVGLCPSVHYIRRLADRMPRMSSHLLHVVHEADLRGAEVDASALKQSLRQSANQLGLKYDETNHMGTLSSKLLKRYLRAAVVVASRLHGCIFSYALGIPFVGIECDYKLHAFKETHAATAQCLAAHDVRHRLDADLLRAVYNKAELPASPYDDGRNQTAMSELLIELQAASSTCRL